jgi:hypothetical protein
MQGLLQPGEVNSKGNDFYVDFEDRKVLKSIYFFVCIYIDVFIYIYIDNKW